MRCAGHGAQVYRVLMQRTACVQPLSCDEAFLDVTGLGDPEAIASEVEYFCVTSCILRRKNRCCPRSAADSLANQMFMLLPRVGHDNTILLGAISILGCAHRIHMAQGYGQLPETLRLPFQQVRAEILAATGCTASAGIGPNMLLARLATKAAKPNGQLRIRTNEVLPLVLVLSCE